MPKIVDREERRARIAEVVWRIVGDSGLDAVTMLSVARETGFSAGSIQHYFANKNELVRFAMSQTFDHTDARLEGIAEIRPAIDALKEMALAILPMDQERQADVSAWLGFVGRIGTDEVLLDLYTSYYARARGRWRDVLQLGIADGSVRADIDIEMQADILVGVIDGLSMQAVLEKISAARMSQTLDTHLAVLRPSQ